MIRIRTTLLRQREHFVVLAASLTLALAVVWAHGALGEGQMGRDHGGSAKTFSLCLGVLEIGGAVGLVGTFLLAGRQRSRSWLAREMPRPTSLLTSDPICPRNRAGPAELQVFLL
jgi:hypothetical protein